MKKHLLKPCSNDGEMLFLPGLKELLSHLNKGSLGATAHHPDFFNPGISLKFLFLDQLKQPKKFIFLDNDRVDLKANIPSVSGLRHIACIESERALFDYPMPEKQIFDKFFGEVDEALFSSPSLKESHKHFLRFKDIFYSNLQRPLLKDALVESFLSFYDIQSDYSFVSDIVAQDDFKDFFNSIYKDAEEFREAFNRALDDYSQEFKFRFKNFPFPKLEQGELPFWVIKEGKRSRLFKDAFDPAKEPAIIFPRASTLTIFLRLYKSDLFIHGVGGANYDWVSDRVIERFFGKAPPLYAVVSGTFLLESFKERELPYFLFDPQKVKAALYDLAALQTA